MKNYSISYKNTAFILVLLALFTIHWKTVSVKYREMLEIEQTNKNNIIAHSLVSYIKPLLTKSTILSRFNATAILDMENILESKKLTLGLDVLSLRTSDENPFYFTKDRVDFSKIGNSEFNRIEQKGDKTYALFFLKIRDNGKVMGLLYGELDVTNYVNKFNGLITTISLVDFTLLGTVLTLLFIVALKIDIEGQKRRLLNDSIDSAVIQLDNNLKIKSYNQAFLDMFEDVDTDTDVKDLFKNKVAIGKFLDSRGVKFVRELEGLKPKTKKEFPVKIVAVRYSGLFSKGYLINIEDKTSLEQEIYRRGSKERIEMLMDSGSTVSSILRKNLQTIKTSLGFLNKSNADIDLLVEAKSALKKSEDSLDLLYLLLGNEYSKPQTKFCSEIIETTGVLLKTRYPNVKLQLNLLPGLHFKVVPWMFVATLRNLVENAKESMASSSSDIKIIATQESLEESKNIYNIIPKGDYLKISVVDSGDGIPQRILSSIFEPYISTKSISGSGLGLVGVLEFLKKHEGYVDVATSNLGTTVSIYLKYDYTNVIRTDTELGFNNNRKRVLLVDDEDTLLFFLEELITEAFPYIKVDTASNGIEALGKFSSINYDLIISDITMPEMDGNTLYTEVKNRGYGKKFIFLSGLLTSDLLELGENDSDIIFIKKPFSNKDIIASIEESI